MSLLHTDIYTHMHTQTHTSLSISIYLLYLVYITKTNFTEISLETSTK